VQHLLARRFAGDEAAAYVAGFAFAFAPWRVGEGFTIPQLLSVQYLPLILLGLDRVATTGGWTAALLTAIAIVLQALCSYYVGYQVFVPSVSFCSSTWRAEDFAVGPAICCRWLPRLVALCWR
jgi:hypothetical protein